MHPAAESTAPMASAPRPPALKISFDGRPWERRRLAAVRARGCWLASVTSSRSGSRWGSRVAGVLVEALVVLSVRGNVG